MPMQRDPEAIETAYLHKMADLGDVRVLEVGCGDGRLTWRYGGTTRHAIGIDSNRDHLAVARRSCPPSLGARVAFAQATALALPFRAGLFDGAMLAWSL